MKTHTGIEADTQIYRIGGSLRLPGCIKIKNDQILAKKVLIP